MRSRRESDLSGDEDVAEPGGGARRGDVGALVIHGCSQVLAGGMDGPATNEINKAKAMVAGRRAGLMTFPESGGRRLTTI